MPAIETIEALIVVRTYPTPAKKNVEVSCIAGITRHGQWVRLFPIPYRLLEADKRFQKYQWIKAQVRKAADHRAESYTLDIDSLEIASDVLSTDNGWRARKDVIFPLRSRGLCSLKKQRDENKVPTLGIFRPKAIKRLLIEPAESPVWSDEELAALRQEQEQGTLFNAVESITELEKIPYDFRYEFVCDETGCGTHRLKCIDWEMGAAWRSWRDKYGDQWETKFREKFESDLVKECDLHFCVGTLKAHPAEWNIVGLFYPPRVTTLDLFGPN